MATAPWTWNVRANPGVASVLAAPSNDSEWCDRLETAGGVIGVGKVLCVCAAGAVARAVLATSGGSSSPQAATVATDTLELLDRWIDDPTEERFDRICAIIFGDQPPELDAHGVVWWALRTATSTEGYGEAGWALATTCSAAAAAGFTPEQLRAIAERAILSRATQ